MSKTNLKLDSSEDCSIPDSKGTVKPKIKPKRKQKKNIARTDFLRKPDELFLNTVDSVFDKITTKSVLVIEIDQSEIRILQLNKVKGKYNFGYWSMQDITQLELNRAETELLALRNLIDKKLINTSEIILTLHGPEIIIRTLTAPKLEGNELREAVFWKNKNELPNLSDDALWDFEIIGEVEEDKKRVYNVLSIIAYDAYIRKQLNLLAEIDIFPKYVFAKPIALAAALHRLTNEWALEEKISVLGEIGKDTTLLSFYRDGNLEYVHTMMFGSNKIDRALNNPIKLKNKKIRLHSDKIDIYKQKHGILLELLDNSDDSNTHFPYNHLFEFIKPVLQMFVSELKRSFAFYLNSHNHDNVDILFITGGGTKLKNLDKFLQRKMDVPVHSIAPAFPSIMQGSFKPGYEYTACFGAGIRKKKNFNFIPKDIIIENKYRQANKSLLVAIAIIFAIILTFSSFLYFDRDEYISKVEYMESRYQELHPSEVVYKQVMEEVRLQEKKKQELIGNVNIDSKIMNVLKVFSNSTPTDIALTSLEYFDTGTKQLFENIKIEESMVVIKGMVYKNFLSADITLIEFMDSLKKLNYFKEITLADKTKRINDRIFIFKIHCKI